MASPQPAMVVPKEIIHSTLNLPHKPTASIHYTLAKGTGDKIMIVFLNGLMTDKTSWIPVIASIIRQRKGTSAGFPTMLTYDRYGQGMTSDRDPQDEGKEAGHGHDCASAAEDLHHLIQQISEKQLGMKSEQLRIILVANSIGCAIGRLYAQVYPIAAFLLLDSIMANSNFDLWPNPDSPQYQDQDLGDVPLDVLRDQRAKFTAIFHPSVPNKEGLSRRNLATLLPHSDRPILGTPGNRPWITIVGHDFSAFAEESLQTMGTPKFLSTKYSNPIWDTYNQGLTKLTDEDRRRGPVQAKGCGHFIQRDDPNFVVEETLDLLDKVRMQESASW